LNRDTIFVVPGAPGASAASQTNLFPIFNFNASVSLGTFTNRKNRLGIAEQRVKIAESNKRYENYLMHEEILKAVIQAEQNANQALLLITDLFKADKATFEDYNSASISYNAAVEKRIKANAELNIAQYLVEEMIGISLDEAKRMRK